VGHEALGVYVALCTTTDWGKAGWPDLRKAVENIYGMFIAGVFSRDETIEALKEIVECEINSEDPRDIRQCAIDILRIVQSSAHSG